MALSQREIQILAQTLLGEAGGEGLQGMRAVAHVIRNRMASNRFPNSAIGVAQQPQQFSAWNSGEGGNNPGRYGPGSAGWNTAIQAINQVFNGNDQDITGGATHYWAPRGMPNGRDPYWARSETTNGRVRIGNQIFLPRNPGGGNSALNAIQEVTNSPAPGNPSNRLAYAPPTPHQRPHIQPPIPAPRLSRQNNLPRRNQLAADGIETGRFGEYEPQIPQTVSNPLNLPIPGTPGAAPPTFEPDDTIRFSSAPPPRIAAYGNAPMPQESVPLGGQSHSPAVGLSPQRPPQMRVPAPMPVGQRPNNGLPVTAPDGAIQRGADGETYQYVETTGMAGSNGSNRGWIRRNLQPNEMWRLQSSGGQPQRNTPQTGGLLGRLGLIPMQQGQQATGRPDRAYFERLGQNLPNPQELVRRIGNAVANPSPPPSGRRKFNPQTGKWGPA